MKRAMMKRNHIFEKAMLHWKYIAPLLIFPKNTKDYDLLVKRLDFLLDVVGENENHPLSGLVDILSSMVSSYDEKNYSITELKGIDALKFLMELRNLKQSDLHEIGTQGVVSEILNGKRKLNLRQITILAKLFNVSPLTFMDTENDEPMNHL